MDEANDLINDLQNLKNDEDEIRRIESEINQSRHKLEHLEQVL
jgi:hypothetical protein